jgi:hypothetical protein
MAFKSCKGNGQQKLCCLVLNFSGPLTLDMSRKLSELPVLSVELLIQPYDLNTDKLQQV